MDSILNEITYSDGRMDMQKTQFVDTPAKLKLRARTFEGIHRSLNARRGPIMHEHDFSIPNAFMAMEISADGTSGGNSGFTLLGEPLNNAVIVGKGKRLKVSAQQRDIFASKQGAVVAAPVVEAASTNTPEVIPTVATEPVVPEPVAVESAVDPAVTTEVVRNESPVVPEATAPSVEPSVDPLDAAREKVLNTVTQTEETAVDTVLKTDDFASLQSETAAYTQAQKDYQEAVDLKTQKMNEKEEAEAQRNNIADEIDRKRLSITEQAEVRDSMQKSNAKLEAEIEETKKDIVKKRSIFQRYTAQVQKDRDRTLKAVADLDGQIQHIHTDTDNKKKQLQDMDVEFQNLSAEATEASTRGVQLQEELNRLKEIVQAIQLPDDVSVTNSSEMDMDMPQFVDEDEYDQYAEKEPVKSYGKAA